MSASVTSSTSGMDEEVVEIPWTFRPKKMTVSGACLQASCPSSPSFSAQPVFLPFWLPVAGEHHQKLRKNCSLLVGYLINVYTYVWCL